MPQTPYNYSIQNDFTSLPPGGQPNLEALEAEIAVNPAVDQSLVGSSLHLDDVTLEFVDALSPAGKTALDGVVAAHTGVPLIDTPQRVNTLAVQNNPNTVPIDAIDMNVPAVRGGNWQITWYCEISVQSVVANSGAFARVLIDGIERGFTSNRDDQYVAFSGSGLITYDDGDTPHLQLQIERAGVPNTARIRRCQIALIRED